MLGAGNVATHISRHLYSRGHSISCVYSKTEGSATNLAERLNCTGTSSPESVPPSADFYIICTPDHVIPEIVQKFQNREGIWLHTAGAVTVEVFKGYHSNFGVLYPLQTFRKNYQVSLPDTPLLIEGSAPAITKSIKNLAHAISRNVHEMDSSSRLVTHLAAVFANNFTNHMVHIAQEILRGHDIDLELIDPLVNETFNKLSDHGATSTQTGPAFRGDNETMKKHLEILKKNPDVEKLYTFISQNIARTRDQ